MRYIDHDTLTEYIFAFENLNRATYKPYGRAPHKPVLLLTIIDAIETGIVTNNYVPITPEFVLLFRTHWRSLVPANTWKEVMMLPFRHLLHDGFWMLVKNGHIVSTEELGDPRSLTQLCEVVDGGRFKNELWELLAHTDSRRILKQCLLDAYFPDKNVTLKSFAYAMQAESFNNEITRLIAEPKAKFQLRTKQADSDELGVYIRHVAFPKVIRTLYQDTCAVCRMSVGIEDKSAVEAAHIMPFAKYHNDDPRNGLALCKNHHWGFDEGAFTITSDYKITASKRLRTNEPFIPDGKPLLIPDREDCLPAMEALKWHRENRFAG